jgi:hypothetical protein
MKETTMQFRIAQEVTKATGTQYWLVDAVDADEARKKHNLQKSEFECEEIEVTELGEFTVKEIE